MDKVVQKAICLVLEAIYEPYFEKLNRSFGFRPNKGVHDAMTAFKTYYTQGMRNAIEGDVEKAFDSVIKKILLKIMSKRIQDRKFLKLMEDRLNYEYVEIVDGKEIRHTPEIGIPQGGIDSPYLFNIYMNELDEYIEYELKAILEQKNHEKNKRTNGYIKSEIRSRKRKMRWIKEEIHETTDPEEIEKLRQELYTHQTN
jgi:retron-type reverse transcriptase